MCIQGVSAFYVNEIIDPYLPIPFESLSLVDDIIPFIRQVRT